MLYTNKLKHKIMNAERFFQELMLEAITRDIKQELNQGLKKPFERLVKIIKIENDGVKTFAPMLCNN